MNAIYKGIATRKIYIASTDTYTELMCQAKKRFKVKESDIKIQFAWIHHDCLYMKDPHIKSAKKIRIAYLNRKKGK